MADVIEIKDLTPNTECNLAVAFFIFHDTEIESIRKVSLASVLDFANGLKLIDKDYVPFAGSLNADVLFSVGSNDNIEDNAGVIETSNHFVGEAVDLKLNAHGADKAYRGRLTQFRVGGDYSGSPNIYGHSILVNNRLNTGGATPNLYGEEISVSAESAFNEAVGLVGIAYRGGTIAGNKIGGIRGIGANGYDSLEELFGVEGLVITVSTAATVTLASSILARLKGTADHAILEWRGVNVTAEDNAADVYKSVGIYADESIDIGINERYFIKSTSISPSLLSGRLYAPNFIAELDLFESNPSIPIGLSVDSVFTWQIYGTNEQQIILPDVTTLTLGHPFLFVNDSTKNLTIEDNAQTDFQIIPPKSSAIAVCSSITDIGIQGWEFNYYSPTARVFEPHTVNYTIPVEKNGRVFTNEGASADFTYTLPPSADCWIGLTAEFIDVHATLALFIKPQNTDVIKFRRDSGVLETVTNISTFYTNQIYTGLIVEYIGNGVWRGKPQGNWTNL